MNKQQLFEQIKLKKSFLCVGLDTDVDKLPSDEVLERHSKVDILDDSSRMAYFNKAIIDKTFDLAVAYKPNLWFYLSRGSEGMSALSATVHYIKRFHPEILVIIDAKVGDIGNTSEQAAKAFFDNMPGDAVTINPYMGKDVAEPFLKYEDKWIVVLGLTSNKTAQDFQLLKSPRPEDEFGCFYEEVLLQAKTWGNEDNTMFVVGATQADLLQDVRKIVPNHFLLVPGIGKQGGNLNDVASYGMNDQCGLLVNSSRDIIYAANDRDFGMAARSKAEEVQQQMQALLEKKGLC